MIDLNFNYYSGHHVDDIAGDLTKVYEMGKTELPFHFQYYGNKVSEKALQHGANYFEGDEQNYNLLVVSDDKGPVSFVEMLYDHDTETYVVERFEVLHGYRGKGIGSKIIERLLYDLEDMFGLTVLIDCFDFNVDFYRKAISKLMSDGKTYTMTETTIPRTENSRIRLTITSATA